MGLEKHGCYSYPLAAPLQVADRQENAGTERVAAPALVPDCSEFSRVPEQGLRQACSISLLAEDIRLPQPRPAAAIALKTELKYRASLNLNLRASPDTGSANLLSSWSPDYVPQGTIFVGEPSCILEGAGTGWCKIPFNHNGVITTGWVNGWYLEKINIESRLGRDEKQEDENLREMQISPTSTRTRHKCQSTLSASPPQKWIETELNSSVSPNTPPLKIAMIPLFLSG